MSEILVINFIGIMNLHYIISKKVINDIPFSEQVSRNVIIHCPYGFHLDIAVVQDQGVVRQPAESVWGSMVVSHSMHSTTEFVWRELNL